MRQSTRPVPSPPQEICFAKTPDGSGLAYAFTGNGYPLVRAPHWLTHLQGDWQTGAWSPWLSALSARYRLLRFDASGTGLSDPSDEPVTLDGLVDELSVVVEAAGVRRFALLGMSQGAAVAIRYAARFPERVSHLVIHGGYVRGQLVRQPGPETERMVEALCDLIRIGWGVENSAFRQIFTTQFFPAASAEQTRAFNDLELLSATPERAAQMLRGFAALDAQQDLIKVGCPTLVFHTRRDARIPFEEGRLIATSIPHAVFVPGEGLNHLPLASDDDFDSVLAKMSDFLPQEGGEEQGLPALSAAQLEVLELLAQGLDNAQIAACLGKAEKTIRNRVSALFEVLQLEGRSQAIVFARERGLGRKRKPTSR